MATTHTKASPVPRAGWLRRTWEKIATVLAVIGLIDVSSQLIHWAALIHWVVTKYVIVRAWLFGWLPFHIPPEWHDPIVLFLIFISVTNVGVYRKYRQTLLSFFYGSFWETVSILVFLYLIVILADMMKYDASGIAGVGLFLLLLALIPPLFVAAFFARRWLLTTAAIFGALVIVNQVYVLSLEPLAQH